MVAYNTCERLFESSEARRDSFMHTSSRRKGDTMYFLRLFWVFCLVLGMSGLGCSGGLARRNDQEPYRFTGPIVHRDFLCEPVLNLIVLDQRTGKPLPGVSVYEHPGTKNLGETDEQGRFIKPLTFFGGDTVPASQVDSTEYDGQMVCILILRHPDYRENSLRLVLDNVKQKALEETVYMISGNM